ncbi:MAG: phytanoyl-CoA dioxygenase family protein [Planctomycetota bacterium]|jgi:ectoine hydroxylase-related dioxygenase (phytanoyl-CoA dioxygenase family)|nr:phytanoyl-CoA dioxygenase family protein [Planctomycetota bacterium]
MPALKLTAYHTTEEQVNALKNDGYVYFPEALNPDEVKELYATMDRQEAIPESFDRYDTPESRGFLNRHVNNAFNRDEVFLQYIDRPGIIDVVEAIHGEDCHLIGMTAWMTGPGRPQQSLHVDWLPVPLPADVVADPRVKVPVFITTLHFYLDNLTEELGPTQFVPGSHKSGRAPGDDTEWLGNEPESILCNAGDAVLFRSEVWHRGTANTSDQIRFLLQVHYAHRMITQKFPPYLNRFQFDGAILEKATERQLRLLGDHRSGIYD